MALSPLQLGSGKPKAPLIPYLSNSRHPIPLLPSSAQDFLPADDPFTQQAREEGDINPGEMKPRLNSEAHAGSSRVAKPGDLPLPSDLPDNQPEFQCQKGHAGLQPRFTCPQGCSLCKNCLKNLIHTSRKAYHRCECGRVFGLAEVASLTS